MSPTQPSIDHQLPNVRLAVPERHRLRDPWMLAAPVLIIVVSLYHLAMYWNSPQTPPMGSQPHLTIHSVRAGHQVLAPTKESRSEPTVVADGEPAFDSAAIPEPGPGWPYRAGWR
jgi:hypothetical protein